MTLRIRRFAAAAAALVIVAFSIALLSHGQTENPTRPAQAGRFQICDLQYQTAGGPPKNIDVFGIDTQTGETWKYVFFAREGKIISLRSKIDEQAESK